MDGDGATNGESQECLRGCECRRFARSINGDRRQRHKQQYRMVKEVIRHNTNGEENLYNNTLFFCSANSVMVENLLQNLTRVFRFHMHVSRHACTVVHHFVMVE